MVLLSQRRNGVYGLRIRDEATEIAKKLNNPAEYNGSKASSGWLEC